MLEGLFIGAVGAGAGLLAGLLLSVNVNEVFGGVEHAVSWVMGAGRLLALPFAPGPGGAGFRIFSPSIFYLSQIPSHVYLREAFMVSAFAVVACAGAAWAASRAVSRFRPSEVLRYE